MNNIIGRFPALFAITILLCGCASTRPYFANRCHDAADMLTLTVGKGGGATVRAGPIHFGLFGGFDHVGLRGGKLWTRWERESLLTNPLGALVDPLILLPGGDGICFFEDDFSEGDETRGKNYIGRGLCPFVAIPAIPGGISYNQFHFDANRKRFLTQIDASAGLYYSIHAGVDFAEIFDFILGWTTLDIMKDDLLWNTEGMKQEKQSEQSVAGYPPQGVGSPEP